VKRDLISIVEGAYDLGHGPEGWMARLAESIRPFFDEGSGVCALLYDASSMTWTNIENMALLGMDPVLAGAIFAPPQELNDRAAARGTELSALAGIFRHETLAYSDVLSRDTPTLFENTRRALREAGMADLVIFNCANPTARGLAIAAPVSRRKIITKGMRELWIRIGAHVAAGHRLLRNAAPLGDAAPGASPRTEAILDPRGRVEHAEGPATQRSAREALLDAALRMDRARGRLRRERPEEAVEVWEGLVSGRWSLVERFDRDGRRYLLAHRNEPAAPDLRGLTTGERQVLSYAALGHANKLIAYDLGLSPGAVSRRLASAARKLGARTRAELMELHGRLAAAAERLG
jgi:DNA-binding CsgD family transcriptional regulator